MRWITSFLVKKKINIHFIDCLCVYKSVYVYWSLYFLCVILQAVSAVLSTTSSWLFCMLPFKHVIYTYSTAKAQDSPCSLCRPGVPTNIKEHFSLLAHSRWKQWMRYRGGADVDGSCRPWTEVVFRGRKLHCGPWTEVVSHVTPPHSVEVKINFDEA